MDTDGNAEELFKRYSDMIYRIALSHGNPISLAEDVVQEVFLRFLKKNPQFQSREHEKAWFIRVAVNCSKSMVSSAWMKRIRPLEDAGQTAVAFQQEEAEGLYELLAKLPTAYRIVLYLRYYEEYPVKEIAEILHITPNLVSARLSRARKRMKKEIAKERGDRGVMSARIANKKGMDREGTKQESIDQRIINGAMIRERKCFGDEAGIIQRDV